MDRIIAPVSFARTRAPETFGFEQTRANVVSRSVLFNDGGGDIDIMSSSTLSGIARLVGETGQLSRAYALPHLFLLLEGNFIGL